MAQTSSSATPNNNTGNAQQQAFHSASLYVGDLDPDVTEALLFEVFNAVGPVASIRVCRDGVTRRSLGYGYVNFHNTSDAERALDTMNYTPIRGRACRIMWSQRDPSLRKTGAGNVFVKNLDETIDNKALYDTFSLFGNILSCKVVCDKTGKSRGYGFVHYETVEAAEEAIRKINGMLIAEKTVYVGHFLRRENRSTPNTWTNVYVKNLPDNVDDESLKKLFTVYGDVTSCVIMKQPEGGKSKCFGFINYDTNEAAQGAVTGLNGKFLDVNMNITDVDTEAAAEAEASPVAAEGGEEGDKTAADEEGKATEGEETKVAEKPKRPLFVGRAQKKFERQKELRDKFEKLKVDRLRKYEGVNLYVKNLDENVDEERLRTEFSRFGGVTSTRVMKDENQHSKGFGFICFTTPEEATAAITELNGKMLAGKPLYVALAQRKEVRRQALEQHYTQRGMPMMPGRGGMPNAGQPQMYGGGGGGGGGGAPAGGMYYQGGPTPPFMYPGQMARGPAGHVAHPAMYGRGGYQPMPAGYPNRQQQMGGRGRGPHRGPAGPNNAAQAAQAQAQAQAQAAQAQQQIKFTAAARNMQAPVAVNTSAAPAPVVQQQQLMVQQLTGLEPLTASTLASVSAEQQKNMIGERLYPLIHQVQPELAGKITGMLLEMDNGELLHLLESPDALHAKITEALQVLDAHSTQ